MSEETKETQVPETEVEVKPEVVESAPVSATASPRAGFLGKVDNFFGISKADSNFKTEILAGVTTFMTMVYILLVNPGIFTSSIPGLGQIIPDVSFPGMYIATALGAIVGTLLMAFLAKMPLAQASGMGVNAFVVFSLVLGGGLTYANAMVFTLLDGVIFILLTATGARKYIFAAIPDEVKRAVVVGLGLFIAFIGLQNAKVVVGDASTLVTLVSFNVLAKDASYMAMVPALVAILGVVAIAVLSHHKVHGSILWGILGSTVLYYALIGIGCALPKSAEACKAIFTGISFTNPIDAFAAWGKESAGAVFYEGFNFDGYLANNNVGSLVVLLITSALSLCMLDMFDTLGTLFGACSRGNLLDEKGQPLRLNQCMLADAIATTVGAIAGTSTVTTYVESTSGISVGGKTGFTSLVTGVLFLVAMFLSPIAQLIPSCATATALIWVGVLMMGAVTEIDWRDPMCSLPAFITIAFMAFGYGISEGFGMGIIASIIMKVCAGRVKEVTPVTWVVAAFFLATFIIT